MSSNGRCKIANTFSPSDVPSKYPREEREEVEIFCKKPECVCGVSSEGTRRSDDT